MLILRVTDRYVWNPLVVFQNQGLVKKFGHAKNLRVLRYGWASKLKSLRQSRCKWDYSENRNEEILKVDGKL